ncbi:MAG: hypothetical protein M3Q65_18865 [Chloroflexota bacterium]|nr:hypothetical protein [Chloroflexota bacterium]
MAATRSMAGEDTMTNGMEPLRAALAGVGMGVGCHYRLRAEGGLTVEVLDRLGLVKPIRQRIPNCDEHACPLRAGCRFAPSFAEERPGRSGRKFRLTPLGEAATRDDAILRQVAAAVSELPLSRRILAALATAGGTLTVFALDTALLGESLAALAADGDPGPAGFSRGDLAAGLTLLAALDLIAYDGRRVALAPAG